MFWSEADKTHASISQFSARDADAFFEYEDFLGKVREIIQPLLDNSPPEVDKNVTFKNTFYHRTMLCFDTLKIF